MIITKARYAKNSIAVRCQSSGGWKTDEHRLVEAMGGRYVGREDAYILPASKQAILERAAARGWSGEIGIRRPQLLIAPDDRRLTYREAKAELLRAA